MERGIITINEKGVVAMPTASRLDDTAGNVRPIYDILLLHPQGYP